MKQLPEFRMGGVSPFLSHGDVVNDSLREARALLIIIEQGFRAESDLKGIVDSHGVEVFDTLNPTIMADAIEGIASLLALAQYCRDEESAERRPQPGRAVAA